MQKSIKLGGYKVIVTGAVQGVGFRYFTSMEAKKLTIKGHAKNLNNGDVEVEMFGEQDKLALLLKWLETGPETSLVKQIDISNIAYRNTKGFVTL